MEGEIRWKERNEGRRLVVDSCREKEREVWWPGWLEGKDQFGTGKERRGGAASPSGSLGLFGVRGSSEGAQRRSSTKELKRRSSSEGAKAKELKQRSSCEGESSSKGAQVKELKRGSSSEGSQERAQARELKQGSSSEGAQVMELKRELK